MTNMVKTVYVTRHCMKRVVERASIIGKGNILRFLEKILDEGYIVDNRNKNLLIKLGENYLVLRRWNENFLAITYTRNIVPRGFDVKRVLGKISGYKLKIL